MKVCERYVAYSMAIHSMFKINLLYLMYKYVTLLLVLCRWFHSAPLSLTSHHMTFIIDMTVQGEPARCCCPRGPR